MKTKKRQIPAPELSVEKFELSCGARLLVSPRPGATVTAVRAQMRGGPSLDPKGLEGLAYFTGSLADQGTKYHNERELAEILEPRGGHLHGDATGLGGTIAGPEWKTLLDLIAEVLTGPTYPDAEVGTQKTRVLSRLAVEKDDPRAQGAQRFRKLVYGKHWLGRPQYGTLESVSKIEPDHLRQSHADNWCGERLIIAVCGDVKPRAIRNHLEKALSGLRRGKAYAPKASSFPDRGQRLDTFASEREQVHVYVGHLGVRRKDPDYPALVVMDHILGSGPGFTNRIAGKLRDELGLAYSVHADIHGSSGLLPGMFTAYIGTAPQHLPTALSGFFEEMRRIQDEPVTARELETARSYLLGSYALGFERVARRAGYLVSAEIYGLPEDNLTRMPELYAAVTAKDIQRVASEHLHPGNCCIVTAGPIKKKTLAREVAAASAK
ncbi:MAG: zinc protease [Planctomycetota bacterium]